MNRLFGLRIRREGRYWRVSVDLEAGRTDGWTDAWMEEVGVAGGRKGVEEGDRREHWAKPCNKD